MGWAREMLTGGYTCGYCGGFVGYGQPHICPSFNAPEYCSPSQVKIDYHIKTSDGSSVNICSRCVRVWPIEYSFCPLCGVAL